MKNKIIELGYPEREAIELIKVSKDISKDYNLLLKKYPIQYLIGYVNFYGYNINVNENVLIPRPETEFLVDKVIKYSKKIFNNKIDILDIGTGSGAIGIVLSKEIDSNVTCTDISKSALEVAKENARINKANINLLESDIFGIIKGKFDIIVSNPPYISEDEEIEDSVRLYEPHKALYASEDGLYFYKRILKEAKSYLKEKFIIAFEIGFNQGKKVEEIAKKYFSESNIIIEKDLSGKDRYVFIINK